MTALIKSTTQELAKNKFFCYTQNNSGGSFRGPAKYVIVEAASAKAADTIALDHEVYFDGSSNGTDCNCCGDRWDSAEYQDGSDVPSIYGTPLNELNPTDWKHSIDRAKEDKIPFAIVVYKDGRVDTYVPNV